MDRLPKKAQNQPVQLRQALSLQAANLLQRAVVDNLATKVVMAIEFTKGIVQARHTKAVIVEELLAILTMDREETKRARTTFVYPDAKIQAVLDKAVEDIADILLEDVG